MLSLFGSIYGKIIQARNVLYDKGVFESFDLGAHTISIGNITAGGTGKTPLVAYVATLLAGRGERVCILTRGYGRKEPEKRVLVSDGRQILAEPQYAGDEPFELAQKLIDKAIVIADVDRVAAAEWAKRKFGVTTFVLDDGFQHRRAKRDVDIVCIDATDPFGGQKMLPAGRLREPLDNLRRADVVVITRADLVPDITDLRSEITNLNPSARVFEGRNRITGLEPLTGKGEFVPDVPAFIFSGIGNPESFYEGLRLAGINVVHSLDFPDHYVYSQKDIEKIELEAISHHGEILVTTAKDAVKLRSLDFTLPCFVVGIEMGIDDATGFEALI